MGHAGVLDFDYVSTDISHRLVNEVAIPDAVFALFLSELDTVNTMVTLAPTARKKRRRRKGQKRKPGLKVCCAMPQSPRTMWSRFRPCYGVDTPSCTVCGGAPAEV